jgi:CheY-like chemotaxis protein
MTAELRTPLHVLVVDDIAMNRDIAAAFLRVAGHLVTCACGGMEAVAAVVATAFDIVLMDVRMPGVDGLEATRRIRQIDNERGRVPIVALTAHSRSEQVEACRQAGMNGHLAKPYDPQALLVLVARSAAAHGEAAQLPAPPQQDAAPAAALPVLDGVTFAQTSAYLTPRALTAHLHTIAAAGEAVLRRLRTPDALAGPPAELADAVHTLAGSAGLFGFERLAQIGRQFERAVLASAADAAALAEALCTTITASQQEILDRLPCAASA